MSPSRTILRALGWACIAGTLLIAAAWLLSARYGLAYVWRVPASATVSSWSIAAGWFEYNNIIASSPINVRTGWEFWTRSRGPAWRFDYLNSTSPAQTTIGLPLWPAPPVLLILGALLLRFTRPLPFTQCAACGYDLRGLPANTLCPECGRPAIPPPRDPAEPFLPVNHTPAPGTNPSTPINSPPHQSPPDQP